MNPSKTLFVVHCVDTEGPLYESLEATFERVNATLGTQLQPSPETLKKIQKGELNLEGKEDVARIMVAPEMLDYNDHWGKLDAMLDELLSPNFRKRYVDSTGQGWIFNWFIMDHVGYDVNPRRRDIGYHNIFDHYQGRLKNGGPYSDEVHWHFHPMSTYREAHTAATSLLRSPHVLESLCRRIIDRQWFPNSFRAGFHTERPDIHWFLEQWIPFDFSNQAITDTALEKSQRDVGGGRFGDWRRAPTDWSPYHPSHDDYQIPGHCHRTLFRSLNIGTRLRLIDEKEVEKAFDRANQGLPTILSFADHDWRDMRRDVAKVYSLILKVAKKYPEVKWQHAGAKKAALSVLGLDQENPIDLTATLEIEKEIGHLTMTTSKESFGPQPFLAIKTLDQRYLNDNCDLETPRRRWHYTFDSQTVPLKSIETIGMATNSKDGSGALVLLDAKGTILHKKQS